MKIFRLLPIALLLWTGALAADDEAPPEAPPAPPAQTPPGKTPPPPPPRIADAPNNWLTGSKAAEMQSLQTGTPLLILFTNSADPVCIKLRETVIDGGVFKTLIAPRATNLYVDLNPKNRRVLPQNKKANALLKAKYKVGKLPTTVVIGAKGKAKGKVILRIVGCPPDYVRKLQQVIR